MSRIPRTRHSWGDLYRLVSTNIESSLLLTAIKWKIFDFLREPVYAYEVAGGLGFHSGNTELFLNALAGMGVIHKEEGRFVNSERSDELLVSDCPTYLGAFFLHVNEWNEKLSANIDGLMKNGPIERGERDMTDGAPWAESARLSAAYQYGGDAQHIARIVSGLPEFYGMRKMLDLGGGAGFFAMAVVEAHPDMRGIVFEQPPVAAVTEEFIQKYEFDSRVSVMAGNYMTDNLGEGYDFVFAGSTLNFHRHALDVLFKKVYDALNPGGVFMTHQDGLTDERTKPSSHVVGFLSTGLMGLDFGIEQGEISDAMLRAGFKTVRSFTKHSDIGDMDIDIARR